MPIARFEMPDGRIGRFEVPDGTTPEQAQQMISEHLSTSTGKPATAVKPAAPAKGIGAQLGDAIADLPRQVGLTARYGLEGVGGVVDMVGAPIRAGLNAAGANIKPGVGQAAADLLGLPLPQTAGERVVGDATRLVAGGVLPIAAGATLAARGTGAAAGVGRMLAASPGKQLASAAAAGAAGGYTREAGGGPAAQIVASLAAGLAAPAAMGAAGRVAQSATRAAGRAADPARIDATINSALQESGLTLADLPSSVAAGIRNDVAQAYKLGDDLSVDAVRRLADYRTLGATPTRARLTLDPAEVTRQANLAKMGANSADPAAQALAQTQHSNNQLLTQRLNEAGAATADDQIAGAGKIMEALAARNNEAKQGIDAAYNAARDASGRAAALDPAAFTRTADDMLKQKLLQGALPPDIRRLLNQTARGDMPLTVDVAEQFKTRLAEAARDARAQGKGSTALAADTVRRALDDTPLLQGQQVGQEAIDAFGRARTLNRQWMKVVEETPALQAVRDGIEPDKFVQQFIIGSGPKANVMDLAKLKNTISSNPEAMEAVKTQIAAFLKQRALSGAADEVGSFSQSAYNKALDAIGDRKLRLFFQADEVAQLKAIGRVASYEQVQPVGAAVNNSNTAGALGNTLIERIGGSPLLNKLPLAPQLLRDPLQNIALSRRAGAALDVPRSLLLPGQLPQRSPLMLSPAALMGVEDEETRKRREAGLLLP